MNKCFKLRNGLNVIIYPMPNTHSVTIGLYVKAGLAYNDEPFVGITHLLEHLHFRKLGSMTQNELYFTMESLGSTLRASTYKDFVCFSMKVIPELIGRASDIILDLINMYNWSAEDLLKEKKVVLNQIREKKSYLSIRKEVARAVFYDHSLANEIMGSEDTIDPIELTDIIHYKQNCFSESNVVLCVTGNIAEEVASILLGKFESASIAQNRVEKVIAPPKRFLKRRPDIVFADIKGETFLDVDLSFDIEYNSEQKNLVDVLNCILGEGVGSRLQKSIREEKCYTSDICSYIEWYNGFAALHITFSVDKKWVLPCLEEVVRIVQDLKTNITDLDLDVSLPFYTVNRVFYEDDTEEMNFQLAYNCFVLSNSLEPMKQYDRDILISELQNMAKTIFVPKRATIVLLGSTSGITKKSLKQLLDICNAEEVYAN